MASEPMDIVDCKTTNSYRFHEDRLNTFETWSSQIIPNKYQLCKAGFYYSGTGDRVICFSCKIELCKWQKTDDPWAEHLRYSSSCEYLKIVGYTTAQQTKDTKVNSTGFTPTENPWYNATNLFHAFNKNE